jgi:hypothetical protein
MRHVVLSGAIATGPCRMVHSAAAAVLVAPAGRALGVTPRRRVRSKSGRGHSGCRRQPAPGSARTETAEPSPTPPLATAHMDAIGNDWNTAPACVLSTVWGTASIRDLAVEVGAVPASPIRRVLTSRQAGCAAQSAARANLWICGQHKRVAHKPTATTAATDNLNILEISSVRTTPGSPQRQPSRRSALGPTTSSAIYTRVLIAVHNQESTG